MFCNLALRKLVKHFRDRQQTAFNVTNITVYVVLRYISPRFSRVMIHDVLIHISKCFSNSWKLNYWIMVKNDSMDVATNGLLMQRVKYNSLLFWTYPWGQFQTIFCTIWAVNITSTVVCSKLYIVLNFLTNYMWMFLVNLVIWKQNNETVILNLVSLWKANS